MPRVRPVTARFGKLGIFRQLQASSINSKGNAALQLFTAHSARMSSPRPRCLSRALALPTTYFSYDVVIARNHRVLPAMNGILSPNIIGLLVSRSTPTKEHEMDDATKSARSRVPLNHTTKWSVNTVQDYQCILFYELVSSQNILRLRQQIPCTLCQKDKRQTTPILSCPWTASSVSNN